MAKRRRIRWDRVSVAAIILIILIFLLGSCVHSCTAGSSAEDSSEPDSTSSLDINDSKSESSGSDSSSSEPDSVSDTPTVSYQQVTVTAAEVYTGNLILVNEENPCHMSKDELDLEQVYYADDNPKCYEISYPGHTSLNKTALTQFNRLIKAYYTATGNQEVMFNYGYVEVGKEKSNAESATGLDVQLHLKLSSGSYNYISNTAPYSWIYEHMDSYGFILRYPEGKEELTGYKTTHYYTALRYVGTPHAAYITENDLCLEEYLSMLKESYTFGSNMLSYTVGEQTYQIYYVPASATGDTAVPVPPNSTYEISGNNLDGFIVTALTS